jgi:probable rRNA maturation factor
VRRVLRGEGMVRAEIGLAFVDDATIWELNRRFLNHDWPTDVITFPLNEDGEPLAGEIVVSAETARRVAAKLRRPVRDELALYVIHGLLHLCGHDDNDARARRAMRAKERHYQSLLG